MKYQRGFIATEPRLIAQSQSGVFPVFLIQPLLWLLLIGATVAGAMWAKSDYDNGKRDEGRAEIQSKWDEDRAARIKRTTEITLALSGKLMEAKDAAVRVQLQTEARFSVIEARVSRLDHRPVDLSASAGRMLGDVAAAANSARPAPVDGAGEARPDPVPAAAQTVAYSEQEFVAWIVQAGQAYSDAYNLWTAARVREDALRETLARLNAEVKP